MRNETFRHVGCHSALLALLMLSFSTFPMAAQPRLQQSGAYEPASCGLLDQIDPAAFEPMKEFWLEAWGRELVLGEASMALQETSTPGYWDLLLTEGKWTARGTFVESSRSAIDFGSDDLDQAYLSVAQATSLQRWVMVGTVIGSTGNSMSVTAIVLELGNGGETLMRSFGVLQTGADSAASSDFAQYFVRGLSAETGGFDEYVENEEADKSGGPLCRFACRQERDRKLGLSNLAWTACSNAVIAGAITCAVLCLVSPAPPICLGLCDLAATAAFGICLSDRVTRESNLYAEYNMCVQACNTECSIYDPSKWFSHEEWEKACCQNC